MVRVVAACQIDGMTTTSIEELGQRIEQMVKEHLAASQAAVTAAVQRAFGAPTPATPAKRRTHRTMKTAGRRTQEQLAEMQERLHQAVCADPGRGALDLAAAMAELVNKFETRILEV